MNEEFEEIAVIIKVTPDVALAFKKIFPDALIRKITPKEPAREQKPEIKPATVEEREKLLREIVTFCRERNSPVDAVRFFNYYDGRGWVDAAGKNITDWKAKLIEWETNGKNNRPRSYTTDAEYNAKGGSLAGKDINELLEKMEAAIP